MSESRIEVVDEAIRKTVVETNLTRLEQIDPAAIDQIILYGDEGAFDSMGLVRFLNLLEETLRDDFNIEIELMSEKAMSRKRSPFANVKNLKAFIREDLSSIEG